jgi:hypothetical protein
MHLAGNILNNSNEDVVIGKCRRTKLMLVSGAPSALGLSLPFGFDN